MKQEASFVDQKSGRTYFGFVDESSIFHATRELTNTPIPRPSFPDSSSGMVTTNEFLYKLQDACALYDLTIWQINKLLRVLISKGHVVVKSKEDL